jgi:hypothetical protein
MAIFGNAIGTLVKRTVLFYELEAGGKIGFLQLDATVSESHQRIARVTQNEIESGANVADNINLQNEKFQIQGIISEAPLPSNDIRDIALTVQNAGFGALSGAVGALSGGLIPDAGAALKRIVALIQLENFWKNKIPFTVLTGLKKYDDVVITSLTIPVNYKDGNSLRFTAQCEVIRLVESQTIDIPEERSNHSKPKKQSIGKKTKSIANLKEQGSSILFDLFKSAGG